MNTTDVDIAVFVARVGVKAGHMSVVIWQPVGADIDNASPSIEVCLSKPTARDIGALDTNVLQLRAPAEETVQTDFIFQKFHCTRYFQDSFPNKFVGEV